MSDNPKLKIDCPHCQQKIELDLVDMAKTYQVLADVMYKQIKEMHDTIESVTASRDDYREALRRLNEQNATDGNK